MPPPYRRPPLPALLVAAAVFVALLLDVVLDGRLAAFDRTVRHWVLAHRVPPVADLSHAVADVGAPELSAIVLLAAAALLAGRRRTARPIRLAATAVGALLVTVIPLKAGVGRPGPGRSHHGLGYFPSGHTTTAFVCYGTLALLLLRRRAAAAVALAVGTVVGAAMVYSDYHWLTDVLGALALGSVLLWLVAAVETGTTRQAAGPAAAREAAGTESGVTMRARAALMAGAAASWASRTAGRGAGATLPGVVALKIAPDLLSTLAAGRTTAVVSATNGKTTTARMLSAALRTAGPVLSNTQGSNLERGVLSALMTDPRGRIGTCVFEVDELALSSVARAVRPAVYVLGNLSRDQLDRMTEVRVLVGHWQVLLAHSAAQARPEAPPVVVANADDPMVAAAVLSGPDSQPVLPVVWVAIGQPWTADAASCPRCAEPWAYQPDYACPHCGFARPKPTWALDGSDLVGPGELRRTLALTLPGRSNRANAVIATAAAAQLGVDVDAALAAIAPLGDVGGRYALTKVGGVDVRLLLAKNPAGWQEMLQQATDEAGSAVPPPVVLALNAQGPDGKDTSWIWDVPFEQLGERTVRVSGERAEDLAVRLRYAEVPFELRADPLVAVADAARATGSRQVDLLANYTAFTSVRDRLGLR